MLTHPLYGHLSDRYGGRRLTIIGLVLSSMLLPCLGLAATLNTVRIGIVQTELVVALNSTFAAECCARLRNVQRIIDRAGECDHV